MELLVLGLLGLALCFTVFIASLKLLWLLAKVVLGLALLPLKIVGAAADGFLRLALLPVKLALLFTFALGTLLFFVLFPLLLPILAVATILYWTSRTSPEPS